MSPIYGFGGTSLASANSAKPVCHRHVVGDGSIMDHHCIIPTIASTAAAHFTRFPVRTRFLQAFGGLSPLKPHL